MATEDRLWELFSSAPGIALALVMFFVFMGVIKKITNDHNDAYKANMDVLKKNSQVIGECSEVIRESRRRSSA